MMAKQVDLKRVQAYVNTLITSAQTARAFSVSEMTIRDWRINKGLPALVILGDRRPSVRFDPVQLARWAESHGKAFKYPH